MNQFAKHLEGQAYGSETAKTHGSLKVLRRVGHNCPDAPGLASFEVSPLEASQSTAEQYHRRQARLSVRDLPDLLV